MPEWPSAILMVPQANAGRRARISAPPLILPSPKVLGPDRRSSRKLVGSASPSKLNRTQGDRGSCYDPPFFSSLPLGKAKAVQQPNVDYVNNRSNGVVKVIFAIVQFVSKNRSLIGVEQRLIEEFEDLLAVNVWVSHGGPGVTRVVDPEFLRGICSLVYAIGVLHSSKDVRCTVNQKDWNMNMGHEFLRVGNARNQPVWW